MASLYLNSLFKDSTSKYGHILEELGVKTSTYEFGLIHLNLYRPGKQLPTCSIAHQWGPPLALPHQAQKVPQSLSAFLLHMKEQSITGP